MRYFSAAGVSSPPGRLPPQDAHAQQCYVSPLTMDALNAIRGLGVGDAIFAMTPAQVQACIAAGLTGRYTGHSPRVGMAQDLTAANIGLPAVIQAGAWKSSRMPTRYAAKQAAALGAVAQYYAQGSRSRE